MNSPRRKFFISHYGAGRDEVDAFIRNFSNAFIPKVLGAKNNDNFMNSSDTDCILQRIREMYLQDGTVTIVLLGACAHSRRYIYWGIKSSLRQDNFTPNGHMGIVLPSRKYNTFLPDRLQSNWNSNHVNCYARYWLYPASSQQLSIWIEDAHEARTTQVNLINNSQDMMKYNFRFRICGVTH
ncbi:MAG: TIR domain-containing protein [Saccharospirillum sp.]